jgi:hypothetical protein
MMRCYHENARTEAVRRALRATPDQGSAEDLLFLETWESARAGDVAAILRARQIRRANPGLVTEIREERRRGQPLSEFKRAILPVE